MQCASLHVKCIIAYDAGARSDFQYSQQVSAMFELGHTTACHFVLVPAEPVLLLRCVQHGGQDGTARAHRSQLQ